jgi:aspartate/methionine/tyrosine aminotransferase
MPIITLVVFRERFAVFSIAAFVLSGTHQAANMTTTAPSPESAPSRSAESFLHWVKRHVGWMAEAPEGRGIVNLATSGVQTANSATWFERTCRERLPDLLARMEETNEFGLPALKRTIRQKYRIPAEREIYLTAGASAGYRLVCDALLTGRSGAEVLIESPTYQPLAVLPARVGARVIPVSIPINRLKVHPVEAITRAVRPSTAALVLTNLHNPTGSILSRADVRAIVDSAKAVSPAITIVIDETFLGLSPEPFRNDSDLDPCVVTISSLTKTFGLGQLRCGWVVADKDRSPQFAEDWIRFESIGSKILEALSLLAFEQIDALLGESLQHLKRNRELVVAGTEPLRTSGLIEGEIPSSGCLCFLRWTKEPSLDRLGPRLRDEFGILVSPGGFFSESCDHYLRIGFGGSAETVREGLARLTRGMHTIASE